MSFLSKDGKWYKTSLEAMTADRAWQKQFDQQQEQNKLIEQQNRLIAAQKKEQRELERIRIETEKEQKEKQRQHERELLDQQKEMALQKEKHDKEMRILQLFDSIGLHKSYYDKFITLLFPYTDEVAELEEKKIDIEHKLRVMEIESDSILNYSLPKELKEEYEKELEKALSNKNPKENNANQELIKELKIYLPNDISSFDGTPKKLTHEIPDELIKELPIYKEMKELKENRKKSNKSALYSAILLLAPIFGIMLEIGLDSDLIAYLYLFIFFLLLVLIIFFLIKANSCDTKMRKLIEQEISKYEGDKEKEKDEEHKQIKEKIHKKYLNKYETLKEKLNEELEEVEIKKIKLIRELSSPKWNDFTEFRKNHYNSNIEKVLLDAGLKEEIEKAGLVWPKINKNNMIKEGDIDDYIAYFDDFR